MDGYQFEKKCATLLRSKGYSRVKVTKSSGDQGVDIIAYKGMTKYAIQCKYYSFPVGNKAIQEVYAGAKYYDCSSCIVMTNSTFTKSAKDLAAKLNVQLWDNCKVENAGNGFLYKSIRLINIILIILGILVFITAKQPDFPNAQYFNYANSILMICTALVSSLFWNSYIFSIVSFILYLLFASLNIFSTVSSFEIIDLILFIPAVLYLAHALLLKPKKDSKEALEGSVQNVDIRDIETALLPVIHEHLSSDIVLVSSEENLNGYSFLCHSNILLTEDQLTSFENLLNTNINMPFHIYKTSATDFNIVLYNNK